MILWFYEIGCDDLNVKVWKDFLEAMVFLGKRKQFIDWWFVGLPVVLPSQDLAFFSPITKHDLFSW